MADWYYVENGEQRGPIAEADLGSMLANGFLRPDTQVWTDAFGSDWRQANQTALYAASPPAGPPPLRAVPPATPAGLTRPVQGHQLGRQAVASPPALAGLQSSHAFKTTPATIMAFSSLLILPLDIIFAAAHFNQSRGSGALVFWLTVVLAFMDAKRVNAAGLNPERRRMVPFILLTPIGYFWRRAALTRTSYSYLWIWIACTLVITFLEAALLDSL